MIILLLKVSIMLFYIKKIKLWSETNDYLMIIFIIVSSIDLDMLVEFYILSIFMKFI